MSLSGCKTGILPRRAVQMCLLAALLPLSGCFVRTRNILITTPPDVVMSADTSTLVQEINNRYDELKSLTATVNISTTVVNNQTGTAKDYTSVKGYILIRKPQMLRVLGLMPIARTPLFDMVSDGNTFTMYIPPLSKAVTGGMEVNTVSKNAFENLRPSMFLDSMLLQRIGNDELVAVTSDTRILPGAPKLRHVVEEPDYNLTTYRMNPGSNRLTIIRVIHISRRNLLPYQLDVYDADGKIVTEAAYDNYTSYDKILFPSRITIRRPQQQLTVTLDVVKLELNQQLDDDQFKLEPFPQGTTVQQLK